jgi:hypothetical protein
MPFKVVWDDKDPTIVRFDITGQSTWVEAYKAFDTAVEFIRSKPQRVDIIFHEMTAKAIPPGNPIPHFKTGFSKLTALPNSGIICIVTQQGLPKMAQTFVNLMMRIYHFDQSRIGGNFRTLEEARACIAQDRLKLASSTVPK